MIKNDQWILPEGIKETLPPEAMALELYRQKLLSLFYSWGYDLVDPPVIDFYDSLMTGVGQDLELMTFNLTDQMSGKRLGIRSDMTPQVARIDAHHIKHDHPTRFCYIGKVLHTRLEGFSQSRSPIQMGAEIYGHYGYQSDVEIIQLMLSTLETVGIENITLDLGHVSIFKTLCKPMNLSIQDQQILFDAVQRKAVTDIEEHLKLLEIDSAMAEKFLHLIKLHGDVAIIDQACRIYHDEADILSALDEIKQVVNLLQHQIKNVDLFIDLAELRGFHYHTGMVFAAYVPEHGQAIALGGRYDGIGQLFGRARAATGFSTDLEYLMSLSKTRQQVLQQVAKPAIFAPNTDQLQPQLEQYISQLREQGERVIKELQGQSMDLIQMGCNRRLILENNQWTVTKI